MKVNKFSNTMLVYILNILNASEKNHSEVCPFQRLYVAMDEPDGVLGVAAIRKSSPTLQHQILIHDSLGKYLR